MTKVYVGDTGTSIILDCGQDISAATTRTIEVCKPNGTKLSWTATASGTTALQYVTLADTLDAAGRWKLQAKVVLPSGAWLGETAELQVYAAFK